MPDDRLSPDDLLRTKITEIVGAWKRVPGALGPTLLNEFVLRCGRSFLAQPLPGRFRPRPPRYCFANARNVARMSSLLLYVEGFASTPEFSFPVHHAWCADREGKVIDATWERPELCSYLGIAFDRHLIQRYARKQCMAMLVNEYDCTRTDVILDFCPELLLQKTAAD